MYTRCQKCGKQLMDIQSRIRGYGPECWKEIGGSEREEDEAQIPGQMSIMDYFGGSNEEEEQGDAFWISAQGARGHAGEGQ